MEKLVASFLGIWLICGAAAVFLVGDTRPATAEDFALGPFSLAEVLR